MYVLGIGSKKNLEGVHPQLREVVEKAITNSPIDFTVASGVRTVDEQAALYAQGRTKPGSIVTNADGYIKKSNHQPKADGYGYAVDLYAYISGRVQYDDVDSLTKIARHVKQQAQALGYVVEWGGDWKTLKDYPHFELKA
jgi:peptidoglycan L-alanyl-D-glutamate endopeptidase CwlK